ncbi:peptidoglycan D,D-transpeptidase FtsI family protein [Mesobacillus harenae]|uniref:peptidoglycan D,D-transpeptidase FtsI family protein n=1 Tax=Mesobacillus harenae TaxID=2213203 RepID=UPI0015800606|nr:penicillin-binding protein 2 [Mesobacillus harenae]
MLFFIVFLLFSALILRLGIVQIVYGDDFKREIERTEDITVNNPVPRGKMFDRNGKVIVDNIPEKAITYTKYQGTSQQDMIEVATLLAKYIDKDDEEVRERDMKDYWILTDEERAKEKITEAEWDQYREKELTDKEIYNLQLKRITEEDLLEVEEDKEILAIFREFNKGYALTPQIVKKGVTDKEFAFVSENLEQLPGVDTTTDWKRDYVFKNTLRTIIGNISEEGLPSEQLDYYLSRGYSRNDRVGSSYIEQQYEDVLHGKKAKIKNITDKAGNVLDTEVISEGERGKDLVLTIDMDLQLAVEKIIEEEMLAAKKDPRTALLDRAFVVLMDPYTGEILTMAGKQIGKDEDGKQVMNDYSRGTFTSSYNVGSAIKGATVLAGFNTGAITPGTRIHDTPVVIANSNPKGSWKQGLGTLNDIDALKVSSNVYMFHTAIRMANGIYRPGQPLPFDSSAFDTMRNYFGQFGLGVRTGIDLPNEMVGFKGMDRSIPGLLMDLSIGQYDTYTPMQLVQYVSAIANGGYRIQPRMVKEIREPVMKNDEIGPVIQEIEPNVLNKIDAEPGWLERVQEGFRRVMQEPNGTAAGKFRGKPYSPAGKTGTAQAQYDGPVKFTGEKPGVMNLSLVGYAPHDNPEIAMAVMVPWAYYNEGPSINNNIGSRVFDTYFELKKKRNEEQADPQGPEHEVENIDEAQEGQEDRITEEALSSE